MKLNKVVIIGYKSIKDRCELIIDNRITVLIGANDHGKSNLLKAIEALNDDKPITAEDKNWDLEPKLEPRIEWYFTLSEEERRTIPKNLGAKGFKQSLEPVKEGDVIETESVSVEEATKEKFKVSEKQELVFCRAGVGQPVSVIETPCLITKEKEAELLALRPIVELFEVPPNVSFIDSISPDKIEEKEFEVMKGIFIKAGIWDDRKEIFIQTPQTNKKIEDASVKLSKVLTEEWDQGKDLKWRLIHENGNISLQIEDPAVKNTYVKPSLRSSGFKTYFYLCMTIFARTHGSKDNQKYIYLFDEPGTYLHPKAQIDLQRSLEKLSDDTQITFTTHSLFLISKNYPKRNRVILKTLDGTKIDHKPFSENWKSVRNSLGILMSNNLLIADKCLLVEGRSDVIYLMNTVRQLKDPKYQIDIDINDLAISDAGTSSNYTAMAKIMVNDGRIVVGLVDSDNGGDSIKNQVEKACGDLVKVISFTRRSCSIEDLCVDITLFRTAIINVVNNLISNDIRKLKEGVNISEEVNNIDFSTDKTLGNIFKDLSKTWFADEEELSKLSVSMEYVRLYEESEHPPEPSDDAKNLIRQIKEKLELKGERDVSEEVFEEIKE